MVLKNEDVEDGDEVARLESYRKVDVMLKQYEQLDPKGTSEVELWRQLESITSIAKENTGPLKEAAEARCERLATNVNARLRCVEAQHQLVRADAKRAREIVCALEGNLTALQTETSSST